MSNVVRLDHWIRKSVWEYNAQNGQSLAFINAIDELLEDGTIKAERRTLQSGQRVWNFYYNLTFSESEKDVRSSIR